MPLLGWVWSALSEPVVCRLEWRQTVMESDAYSGSDSCSGRVFRLSYASRATSPPDYEDSVALAISAAQNNVRNGVSGVLFSQHGLFFQWLEGPAKNVCEVMSKIARDDRHYDVSLITAGWGSTRRFPTWAMQLTDVQLPKKIAESTTERSVRPYGDVAFALRAFERASTRFYRQRNHLDHSIAVSGFASQLMQAGSSKPPILPSAARDCVFSCAQFFDDVCQELYDGWLDDRWSSAQVAIAMAQLNMLWKRAVKVQEPASPRQRVAIAIPAGSTEILGAVIKADLLRASGVGVLVIRARSDDAVIGTLAEHHPDAIIVAGSRVGWSEQQRRAQALAATIRARLPKIPLYSGGRKNGALSGWPERIAHLRGDATTIPTKEIDWLTISGLIESRPTQLF